MRLLVPDLFWPEFGNVLWKAARRGRLSPASAEEAVASMAATGLPTAPSLPLLPAAFALASAFGRTVYDSLYVAATLANRATLLTADERLADAFAARAPVRWLGAL